MLFRTYSILFLVSIFFVAGSAWLYGEASAVESYKKQATNLSQKRFEQKDWSGNRQSDLTQQSFPFKSWAGRYSSIGSKKWDASVQGVGEKKRFKSEKIEFPTKDMKLSEWEGYLAKLESEAQISTKSTAQMVQDKRIYEMMLQKAERYNDTGELLSLRDINRFQFRKNRSEAPITTTRAGTEDDS